MATLYKDEYKSILIQKINQRKVQPLNNKISSFEDNLLRFKNYAQRFSTEKGSRNDSFMKICREGLALAIPHDDIFQEAQRFIYGDFTCKEAETILNNQIHYHETNNFKSYTELSNEKKCLEIALQIIDQHRDLKTGHSTLVTLDNELYKYRQGIYKKIDEETFALEIRKMLNTIQDFKVSESKVKEVLNNIKSETLIKSELKNNFFIGHETDERFIALKSTVLNLSKAMGSVLEQFELTPAFFCTGQLPFEYNWYAQCPTFQAILDRILKDKADQAQLQFWFAYHLLANTNYGKFMIFIGMGANGKSVILKVLRLLLGSQNVSSVPIEKLSNKDRFSVAETYRKLANIADEMSGDSIDEAFIKNYVTGGSVLAERKYGHPFSFEPTAKLTFSTNAFPKIRDKSEGFWRRLLVLEFKEKILPHEQQPEYLEDKFWLDNGELAGVFNWALNGINYIITSKRLYESPNSQRFTQKTQMASNNAKQWILENLTFKVGAFLDRENAFSIYKNLMLSQGEKSCTAAEFYKEIEKDFPRAVRQDNPIIVNDVKRRGFHNLEFNTFGTSIF